MQQRWNTYPGLTTIGTGHIEPQAQRTVDSRTLEGEGNNIGGRPASYGRAHIHDSVYLGILRSCTAYRIQFLNLAWAVAFLTSNAIASGVTLFSKHEIMLLPRHKASSASA